MTAWAGTSIGGINHKDRTAVVRNTIYQANQIRDTL